MLRSILGLFILALFVFPAPVAQASPALTGYLPNCTGEYFNNLTASGTPVMVRTDAAINFSWPAGTSPGPGVTVENYSVRWSCSVYVATAGTYTFTMVADDGMNLLLDGSLLIWAWYDQGPTAYATTTSVSAGWHTIKVEYYNRTLGGTAQVSSNLVTSAPPPPPPPPPTITEWQGEYFNNPTLSGAPVLVRNDATLNFNWGAGSPSGVVPADNFSVRWTRTLNFAAGTWRFTTTTDDGVRLWIDGTLVLDKWIDQPPTAHSVDVVLTAGNHVVKMEYYERTGGAQARLTFATVGGPPSGVWQGQYFNNVSLAGTPVLVRNDAAVNFNWGEGVPALGVPADNFSVRWDSVQNLPTTGNYTITATSDDGVRVWIDGVLVIDGWYDHPPTTFSTTRHLTAGPHSVRIEYYDSGYGALVNVQIGSGAPPPPPPPPPPPIGDVIIDDKGPGWQAGGVGGWYNSPAGINSHSFWTYNNTYTAYGYNWARWHALLSAPGYYEVFVYIPGGVATTLNARYWVHHNNRYSLAPRSQGFYSNQWISLGTYYFHAQGGEYVSLADVTYECFLCRTLVFDAVKFSPR